MLFFSEVLNAEVRNQSDDVIGKLDDIAIKLEPEKEYPPIIGILVKTKKGDKNFIGVNYVESFGKGQVTLNNGIHAIDNAIPAEKDVIFVRQTILDRQIVDLRGIRVVRVNDLQFGVVQYAMSLVAIDVGRLGLWRRLGLAGLNFFNHLKPQLIEWRNIRLVGDKLQLLVGIKELVKMHPADIANIIEKLNLNQGSQLLQALDQKTAARVLEEIEPDLQRILVESLGPERAANVMQRMSVDELVDLIQMLPAHKSKEIMSKLPIDSKTQKIKKILEYDEDTAGGLMSTEFVTASPSAKVQEVVDEIRSTFHLYRSIYFIYIIDENGKFIGVVSIRRLLVAEKDQTMDELLKDVKILPTIYTDHDVLDIASMMTKYNLLSVAVLDKDQKLVGVVTVDDVMRHFMPHA